MKFATLLILLTLCGSAYAIQPADVAFWSDMGESSGTIVADSGLYGHDGTLSEDLPRDATDVPANLPHSIFFSASAQDVLRYPSTAITNVGDVGEDYTIAVWFKTSSAENTFHGLFGQYDYDSYPGVGNPDGQFPFSVNLNWTGTLLTTIYDGQNNPNGWGEDDLEDGEWHQVVLVRDSQSGTVYNYVDGSMKFSYVDTTNESMSEIVDIFFGLDPASQVYFDGKLAQPVLLTAALDSSDVAHLYNHGKGRTYQQMFPAHDVPEFSLSGLFLLLIAGGMLVAVKQR